MSQQRLYINIQEWPETTYADRKSWNMFTNIE